jgi:type VI protein secretion system component Hcp
VANDAGDVLMMVVGSDGKGVPAECQSQIDGKDDLMEDFIKGTFFEIQDFDFGINVEDRDDSDTEKSVNPKDPKNPQTKTTSKAKTKFSRWMAMPIGASGKTAMDGDSGYPVDLEPFSFSRQMDKASPLFFHACGNKISYKSATLVKRKDIGSDAGLQAYLRIDFTDVLFISIGWDNGETIKEKCKFIARQVIVQYRPQASHGLLGPVIAGNWQRKMETKA